MATIGFFLLIAVVFVIAQTALAVPYLMMKVAASPGMDVGAAARNLESDGLFVGLAELLAGSIAIGVTLFVTWLRRGPAVREYLALRAPGRQVLLRWLLWTIALGLALDGLSSLAGHDVVPRWMEDVYASAVFLPLLLCAFLVVAPVLEELVFRGFLFEGLRHSVLGDSGAIVVASLTWASVHVQYEWFYVGQVFAFGLLLGLARLRTGTLVAPILMHALFSGIATLQLVLRRS